MDMDADAAEETDVIPSAPLQQGVQLEHCIIENLTGIYECVKTVFIVCVCCF